MESKKISTMFKSLLVLSVLAMVPFVANAFNLDLVAKVAVTSFDALIKTIPDKVSFDSTKGGWTIQGLDSKDRIILSKDFSSKNPDISLELDAAPFVKAGLDVAKLPASQYIYDGVTGKITMPFTYGQAKFGAVAKKSLLETFKQIIKTHRPLIGYHEQLDHYGIALGDGNMFEWAKDMSTNDKDMVFVLNPQPLIDAGVNPAKMTEWLFAKVPLKDKDGKPILLDKFLKPFNVK